MRIPRTPTPAPQRAGFRRVGSQIVGGLVPTAGPATYDDAMSGTIVLSRYEGRVQARSGRRLGTITLSGTKVESGP